MIENYTFTVPFDEALNREQLKKYFFYRWKKGFKTIRTSLLFFSLMLLFALLSYFGNGDLTIIYSILTTGIATILYLSISHYFKSKRAFFKKIEEELAFWKEIKNDSIVELSNDRISIQNKFSQHATIWERTSYEFAKEMLIINFENTLLSFLFEEKETGKENFEKLIEFLKLKSKEIKK